MKHANPYLNFPGTTEEAFSFYRSVFGGEFEITLRFKDFPGSMGVKDSEGDRIAHIALPLGTNMLMGTDAVESQGRSLTIGDNFSIAVEADSADEATRLFDGLAAGGQATMPLGRTEWAESYGICTDKYGVQWMISYTGEVQFTGGKAN
jgi:PhnB protein